MPTCFFIGYQDTPHTIQEKLDQCDYLVAYIARHGGNTARIYTRAMRRAGNEEIKVLNLADCQSNTG